MALCALKLEWIKKSALEETMSKRIGVVFPHTVDEEILRELGETYHIHLFLEERVTFQYRASGEVLYSVDPDEAEFDSGVDEYYYWHENAPELLKRMEKRGASEQEIQKAMCEMRAQADIYEHSAEVWSCAIRKLVSVIPYVGIIVYMSEDGLEIPVLGRRSCPKEKINRDFIMQIPWRTLMLFLSDHLQQP